MAERHGEESRRRRARSIVGRTEVDGLNVLLARPTTYMNRSGVAVAALLEKEDADPGDLLIVCDDLNLDLETIRIRTRGSHGGHNGLLSIIEHLGTTDFARLRVGVGPVEPGDEHADFVLAPFSRKELLVLPGVVERAADCAEMAVREGVEKAMGVFNRRSKKRESAETEKQREQRG